MSATEIIAELPKLTEAERRAVSRRLRELAAEEEDVKVMDELFVEACRDLDQREAEHAKTKSKAR